MLTAYQAKYFATLLSQKSIDGSIDCIAQSLLNAAVDINPHQIDAALFAFKSPLSKGVILADEVGLGKTIEAGLVICQYWATGKRKIIIVCPAALRKQWSYELTDKFGIANEIIDTKNYNEYVRNGVNPFSNKRISICSYNFAARKKDEIAALRFDLAVIDEAHKLRNVYKKNSKMAHNVNDAFAGTKKLLLTATPFQNSLMELYGLSMVIDENIFGDSRSFRAEYVNEENYSDLQLRLSPYYKRTLRKDVTEYINYTKRLSLTQEFTATDSEQELYEEVSDFLRSENIYAVPTSQKMLTTMIIRKILASSTYALIGTLTTIKERLEQLLVSNENTQLSLEPLFTEEEIEDIEDETPEILDTEPDDNKKIDIEKLKEEIAQITRFIEMAKAIQNDTKASALLKALSSAFSQLSTIGANRKALIFTESTRTQKYLKSFLEDNGYGGKIVLFNGTNTDSESNEIYNSWLDTNAYNGRISGIRAADKRMAIVDYFRDTSEIMIATEAAAEGLNLQFCSLVVNYDLPWNPQRIEQRIGRCHRYGQKSDVVVVNFINKRNYADLRVYNLLNDKFHLFNDVFGASDDVLGQADSIDFERRIWKIYQECRTEKEIASAFEKLQSDMQEQIDECLTDVKEKVLNNFDIDVQEHLRIAKENTNAFLNRYEYIFWELTKYILANKAEFHEYYTFVLKEPVAGCKACKYVLFSKQADGEPYRLSHPLAQYVIQSALSLSLKNGRITFEQSGNGINVSVPDKLQNQSGYLVLSALDISSFDEEQHSLFTAFTKDGRFLTQEECERLFLLSTTTDGKQPDIPKSVSDKLSVNTKQHIQSKLCEIDSRNLSFFKEEEERIFRWEKDLIDSLENELDTVKRQIREAERLSRSAPNMQEKLAITKKIDELERAKRKKRNELAENEDEISEKRRTMISELDSRMIKQVKTNDIFIVEWNVSNK